MELDRASTLPLYHQVKQLLLAQVRAEDLAPGTRVPGDNELCRSLGVSRSVVRQALAELEVEGVVERVKGRGTYVARPRTTEHLVARLTGLHEEMAARGAVVTSVVRRQEVVPADDHVATALQVVVGAPVLVLERLRHVGGEPWVLTTTHLPTELAPDLETEDFTEQSLYAVLEGRLGLRLTHGRRSVEAVAATEETARLLAVRKGEPLLQLRSTTWAGDRPVEVFVALHRGDRTRFEVDLERAPASQAAAAPGAATVVVTTTAPDELEEVGR
ncbi:GntR family transcriptional regulator [Microlunatus flavus]|uniref:GntR family transcriptional regulator n=1 Tax=Microlunatus flavus TaxID=1036181 RepID=A0A1H9NN98_9ACTN|nr:GntR family transcriptional regulator [Microlunatus flavus]SER37115.1 GntR family transcriptional regulator [Microlunatus flavus]